VRAMESRNVAIFLKSHSRAITFDYTTSDRNQ
jgi:hypothetical protein